MAAYADCKEIVLRPAEKQDCIIRKAIESERNVSQSTAILLLRNMVESGLLIKVKDGKQMKNRVKDYKDIV